MTGWRIAFIAGPEWLVKACTKLQGQYTSGPCSVSQKAAEAAYTGTQVPVEEMRKAFERRRDLIVKLAKEVPPASSEMRFIRNAERKVIWPSVSVPQMACVGAQLLR